MSVTTLADPAALNALGAVDFDCVVRLKDVWTDNDYDVQDLHAGLRTDFVTKLAEIHRQREAPIMGWPIIGAGGSGKTHLLRELRRLTVTSGAAFVLVDMTDVRDVWETLLQGYLDSLQQEVYPGRTQQETLLRKFIAFLWPQQPLEAVLELLASSEPKMLQQTVQRILQHLQTEQRAQTLKHQDAIRATFCLNSQDLEVQSIGYAWLQGQQLEPSARRDLGFQRDVASSSEILNGLAWYMSFSGPTVVAFDQLDPIVQQIGAPQVRDTDAREQSTSDSIVKQIGNCFAALHELEWTFPIVSCIEATWNMLPEICLASFLDRFEDPRTLSNTTGKNATDIIKKRLQSGYAEANWQPPYPTWPFTPTALDQLVHENARMALKLCRRQVNQMRTSRANGEVSSFSTADAANTTPSPVDQPRETHDRFLPLDQRFARLQDQADIETLLDEQQEDQRLAPLFDAALRCWVHEHEDLIPNGVDPIVEHEFAGGTNAQPLHARLRLVFHNELGRELHFCVRGLEKRHASAFQNRLRAAITHSGIDPALSFRHLVIVRRGPTPGGAVTQKLIDQLVQGGGKLVRPEDHDLRVLHALGELLAENDPLLIPWLQTRRPLASIPQLAEALVPTNMLAGLAEAQQSSEVRDSQSLPPATSAATKEPTDRLPLGSRVRSADESDEMLTMPIGVLSKHTLILGGAGSGKTVAVRRLVEEAALLGIPALVVDCAQDMGTFDELRAEPSRFWRIGDDAKAKLLADRTEMIVWTPGRESGNPLRLEPIPDFVPLRDDAEELKQAVSMVEGALSDVVASGKSRGANLKRGILAKSLQFFAERTTDSSLPAYVNLLTELPEGAGPDVANESKLAREMADSLRVAIAQNPLLNSTGMSLDPAVLFGDDQAGGRTRISSISLISLPTLPAQREFLNQLAMVLFSWIKKNPHPPAGRALRGLLVIDEAKDFVPSQGSSACKASLQRLAAQARKYKLGMVFATQHPKDIDSKIVGNCATHYYGRASSPASLQTLSELMSSRGGNATDFPKLKTGQFYVHFPDGDLTTPVKVQIPDSLTAGRLLEEHEIQAKSKRSRKQLTGQ